ncbi:MAG: NADH:ubiquinone reductase (Na(+)-transporting) subunit C [Bacteroidota bacterium]|nr:NADH:ubiquinone reductase (Na(+)-transporting) subunit C [Bacteroidota bacterium]
MFTNRYIFIYASVMIIIVASILATAASLLKPYQEKNIEIEKIKNILTTVEVINEGEKYLADELYQKYDKVVTKELVIDNKGNIKEGKRAFDVELAKEMKKSAENRDLPIFVATPKKGKTNYIIPVRGKGLWGPVWGYISIKEDGKTIEGATFGHKGETPGLGAEIIYKDFRDQFIGDQIFDEKWNFTSVKVVKGGANPDDLHGVDAISGGTLTCNGVSDMLYDCLKEYQLFFKNIENNK